MTKILDARIKELRASGMTYTAIKSQLGVGMTTIQYHLNPKIRLNSIERAKKWLKGKKLTDVQKANRKIYMRGYMTERYAKDPEFRKRIQISNRKWIKKRYDERKASGRCTYCGETVVTGIKCPKCKLKFKGGKNENKRI